MPACPVRRRWAGQPAFLGLVVLTLLSATLAPASAAVAPSVADKARGRLAIGDSILLGAAGGLRSRGFRVDAEVGRQFSTAHGIVRHYRARGRLPGRVVIALGTNGYATRTACHRAVRAAEDRTVYLVNNRVPRAWQGRNNRVLRSCAQDFRRAHLINWYGQSRGHPAWIASDGYHLTSMGQRHYTRFVDGRVD
jgi:hypothetical protein